MRARHDINDLPKRFRQCDFAGAAQSIERCRKLGDGFGLGYLLNLSKNGFAIRRKPATRRLERGFRAEKRNNVHRATYPDLGGTPCSSCAFAISYACPHAKHLDEKWRNLPENPHAAYGRNSGSTIQKTQG
ncbi:MAG: hypothetical protein ACM3IH_01295 [Sphingobacteriales bacterium]